MAESYYTFRKKELLKLDTVTHTDNASTQKVKSGGSGIKVILEYIESQGLAWATWDPAFKKKKTEKESLPSFIRKMNLANTMLLC